MEKTCLGIVFLLAFGTLYQDVSSEGVEYISQGPGYYRAKLVINLKNSVEQWKCDFAFALAVKNFTINTQNAHILYENPNKRQFNIGSLGSFPIGAGDWAVEFSVEYEKSGTMPQLETAMFFGGNSVRTGYVPPPSTTVKPTKPPVIGNYHYDEVIGLSLEFYEAQRTGQLPTDNRIWWRGDSFVDDGKANGLDLSGGYFDAADLVKFVFPLVSCTTVLNWGILEYMQAYQSAGQVAHAYGAVRWALDWLIKAHPTQYEFYGQVADADVDHAWWGRPEEWPQGLRQSWKITREKPGTELAAEAAASFASGYLVFKDVDANYANILLKHAKELYEFGDEYRGKYTDAIPEAKEFYESWSGYGDELGWAAAWLYRATSDNKYLTDVQRHWSEFKLDTRATKFSWDDKKAGLQVIMSKLTKDQKYIGPATDFCDYMKNTQKRTPKGLVFIQEWGSLRHAMNIAFVCLNLADIDGALSAEKKQEFRRFAKEQVHYALGDADRSFVVGYGENPPVKPRHRASSCPYPPSPCDRQNGLYNPGPNYYTLYGALVGGPGENDDYVDDRDDYVHNEVAIDYNAGFQGALAALHKLKMNGQLP